MDTSTSTIPSTPTAPATPAPAAQPVAPPAPPSKLDQIVTAYGTINGLAESLNGSDGSHLRSMYGSAMGSLMVNMRARVQQHRKTLTSMLSILDDIDKYDIHARADAVRNLNTTDIKPLMDIHKTYRIPEWVTLIRSVDRKMKRFGDSTTFHGRSGAMIRYIRSHIESNPMPVVPAPPPTAVPSAEPVPAPAPVPVQDPVPVPIPTVVPVPVPVQDPVPVPVPVPFPVVVPVVPPVVPVPHVEQEPEPEPTPQVQMTTIEIDDADDDPMDAMDAPSLPPASEPVPPTAPTVHTFGTQLRFTPSNSSTDHMPIAPRPQPPATFDALQQLMTPVRNAQYTTKTVSTIRGRRRHAQDPRDSSNRITNPNQLSPDVRDGIKKLATIGLTMNAVGTIYDLPVHLIQRAVPTGVFAPDRKKHRRVREMCTYEGISRIRAIVGRSIPVERIQRALKKNSDLDSDDEEIRKRLVQSDEIFDDGSNPQQDDDLYAEIDPADLEDSPDPNNDDDDDVHIRVPSRSRVSDEQLPRSTASSNHGMVGRDNPRLTTEQRRQVIALSDHGLSSREISRLIKIDKSAVAIVRGPGWVCRGGRGIARITRSIPCSELRAIRAIIGNDHSYETILRALRHTRPFTVQDKVILMTCDAEDDRDGLISSPTIPIVTDREPAASTVRRTNFSDQRRTELRRQVPALMTIGMSSYEIARLCKIGRSTVERYRAAVPHRTEIAGVGRSVRPITCDRLREIRAIVGPGHSYRSIVRAIRPDHLMTEEDEAAILACETEGNPTVAESPTISIPVVGGGSPLVPTITDPPSPYHSSVDSAVARLQSPELTGSMEETPSSVPLFLPPTIYKKGMESIDRILHAEEAFNAETDSETEDEHEEEDETPSPPTCMDTTC